MSLNTSLSVRRRWPLPAAVMLLLVAMLLWHAWPQILLQSVLWQKVLNQAMTQLLQQVAAQPHQAGLTLLLLSLAYGVLHALGPGHGKVVIATFLATHPTQLRTSIRLTLLAALLQGGVAVALITLMLVVLQTSSRQLHLSSYWLEKGSYLLVIALGGWLGWRAVQSLRSALRPAAGGQIHAVHPQHQHEAGCACGHAHVPDARQLAQAVDVRTQLLLVLSMGLRPCSGALMMLLFAKVINVYLWGVAAALAMALGTALTVSLLGIVVQRSRLLAARVSRSASDQKRTAILIALLMLLGAIALILAGLLLWQSALPAAGGGLRPF